MLLYTHAFFFLFDPRLHPWLFLLRVTSILVATALLDLPLAVNILGGVVLHRHLLSFVLTRVEWLRFPFHQSVFRNELDPFGSSVGSGSAHTVPLFVRMTFFDPFNFLKNPWFVETLHTSTQFLVGSKACVPVS